MIIYSRHNLLHPSLARHNTPNCYLTRVPISLPFQQVINQVFPLSRMHISKAIPFTSAVLLSATPLAVADNFDSEDIPRACTTICEPIRQLANACDVDDDLVGGDRNEDLLERQCICKNDSFDVANIAGQCQSCIEDNFRDGCSDRDDDDDDDEVEDCDDGREGEYERRRVTDRLAN